jgi:UDPglucose 6-dehydrogenase
VRRKSSTGMSSAVGVIGLGTVGAAVLEGLVCIGRCSEICGFDIDNAKLREAGVWAADSLNNAITRSDILILCLPTLFNESLQDYDIGALRRVVATISENAFAGPVVIRSTVTPGTCDRLAHEFAGVNIVHNPEFLTARTAVADFVAQPHVVCGRTAACDDRAFNLFVAWCKEVWPHSRHSLCSAVESESMKLFANSFYAAKVMIFNEFHQLCQRHGYNYGTIRDLMLLNGWIAAHHTDVPGPDGLLGFGGACFPKDSAALEQFMARSDSPHDVITAVIRENVRIRSQSNGTDAQVPRHN